MGTAIEVARDRTALHRTKLSRPVARALEDQLITETTSVFDYGCGRGGDVVRLDDLGVDVAGFDPSFFPATELRSADLVNLGYVVNVIDDEAERARVLESAWKLARYVLVVSARLNGERREETAEPRPCGDGVITRAGTFQKFYAQEELREWIAGVTGMQPIAAEPGVFYVFRDPSRAEAFALTRVRRSPPRRRKSDVVFEEHEELLRSLMGFLDERGRLPRRGELSTEGDLREAVGSPRQAFQVIKTVTGEERWDRARLARYDDLVVYLALSRFRRRPRLSDLPETLQADIKDFFGSYKAACEQGNRALFAIGDSARVREAIDIARVGKATRSALYVHVSAVGRLPVALRVLEGVARELLGVVPEATLVKIDREHPRVSYLQYGSFDDEPHPALRGAFIADLVRIRTNYLDYSLSGNPPILHRKELFVADDYAHRDRFARLTREELKAGLFSDVAGIGRRAAWSERLLRAGVELRGHRVVKVAD